METEASDGSGQASIAQSDVDIFEKLRENGAAPASCEYRAVIHHWNTSGTAKRASTQWLQCASDRESGAWPSLTAVAA
jgi:hypothetical protein